MKKSEKINVHLIKLEQVTNWNLPYEKLCESFFVILSKGVLEEKKKIDFIDKFIISKRVSVEYKGGGERIFLIEKLEVVKDGFWRKKNKGKIMYSKENENGFFSEVSMKEFSLERLKSLKLEKTYKMDYSGFQFSTDITSLDFIDFQGIPVVCEEIELDENQKNSLFLDVSKVSKSISKKIKNIEKDDFNLLIESIKKELRFV